MDVKDIIKEENLVYKKSEVLTDNVMHYCPGCTHGVVHKVIAEVIEEKDIQDKTIGVSPVGCSVLAYNYIDIDWHEAAHGRAPAVATAVSRLMPDKYVFTYQGDGDLASIGSAEILHACNRGENIVVVFINNGIYGMTGGQYSPTTPTNYFGTTAPYGNIDRTFDIAQLAGAAGATYAARSTVFHVPQLTNYIENALRKKGFSLVEAISTCPTSFGRRNKKGDAVDMIKWLKDSAVTTTKAAKMSEEEMDGKFTIGEFKDTEAPEYVEEYDKLIERLKGEDNE